MILEEVEPKPITDGEDWKEGWKNSGILESCGSFRRLSIGKNIQFDCNFGRNCDTRKSGQQIKPIEKNFEEDS